MRKAALWCGAFLASWLKVLADLPIDVLGVLSAKRNVTLAYVHVPKCGSSFQSMLLLAGCRGLSPPELAAAVRKTPDEIKALPWYGARGCAFSRFGNGHAPVDVASLGAATRVVTVLREPLSRLVSGLAHNFHDCFPMQEALGVREHDPRHVACNGGGRLTYASCPKGRPCARPAPLPDDAVARYARCVRGCQVNLLTGAWCGTRPLTKPRVLPALPVSRPGAPRLRSDRFPEATLGLRRRHPPHHDPTDAETARAVAAVSAFGDPASPVAFVGLTDRWRDTVRLFGAVFKVDIAAYRDSLDANNNAAPNARCADAARAALRRVGSNASDPASEAVYRAAVARFDELLAAPGGL